MTLYYFGSTMGANRKKVERETSSGGMSVNEVLFQNLNPDLPFGGVGYSGYGKYHGFEGFKALSNQKPVFLRPITNFWPYTGFYPPFTPEKAKFITFLTKNMKFT